jgi:hypothetical protein
MPSNQTSTLPTAELAALVRGLHANPSTTACACGAWSTLAVDGSSSEVDDPYRFGRVLTDYDLYLLAEGTQNRGAG